MAEVTARKGKQYKKGDLIYNNIIVRTTDRTPKDIGTWINALKAAETRQAFPNRSRLYDLYETVELDGHLTGIKQKRIDSVINNSLYFEDKAGKKEDALDDLIASLKFREMLKEMMNTIFWGITGFEFIPGKAFDFECIPRKHIKPEYGLITIEQSGQEGYVYADIPNIWVIGGKYSLGLLCKLSPYALYKKGNIADWAQYIELFGQPLITISYDAYDPQTQQELKKVLEDAGSSLRLMIPKQAELDVKDGKQSNGDGKLQDTMRNAMNAEMSIATLGNTETTVGGTYGTGAKSDVHQDQQLLITESDIIEMQALLNEPRFLAILQSYGYPVEGGKFKFHEEADTTEVKAKLDIAMSTRKGGTPVGDDYIYEITGIPKPDDYDQQKADQQAAREAAQQAQQQPTPKPKGKDKTPPSKGGRGDVGSRKTKPGKLKSLLNALTDFFGQAPD